jgi:hypothetical protein
MNVDTEGSSLFHCRAGQGARTEEKGIGPAAQTECFCQPKSA